MDSQPVTTAERPISKPKQEIIKEAKRIEESLLYSSKGHYAAAHFWSNFHLSVGIPMVLITGLASASAVKTFDTAGVVTAVLSIVAVALTSLITFLNPNEKASAHRTAGHNYDSLMSTVRIFWSVECLRTEDETILADKLTQYSEHKSKLNQTCLQIPKFAYKRAKKGIEDGEGTFKADRNDPTA
jgi:hypothetical protein